MAQVFDSKFDIILGHTWLRQTCYGLEKRQLIAMVSKQIIIAPNTCHFG
jgi:hypothetical protein